MSDSRENLPQSTGPLITDAELVAAVEARNALMQFDEVRRLIVVRSGNLRLSSTDVLNLQRLAVQEIWACAGQFRENDVEISHSNHKPPTWRDVPRLVDEMCDYANEHHQDAIHCSSYLVAAQLDPPLSRWEWTNITSRLLCCPLHVIAHGPPRQGNDS